MTSVSSPLREKDYIQTLRDQARTLEQSVVLPYTQEALWPILSNTDMMNQKIGLNPTNNQFNALPQGGSHLYVETKVAGMALAYEELPFEWEAPHFLSVERIYHKGMVKYLAFAIRTETRDQGTEITFQIRYVPAIPDLVVSPAIKSNLKQMQKEIEQAHHLLQAGATGIEVFFDNSEKNNKGPKRFI